MDSLPTSIRAFIARIRIRYLLARRIFTAAIKSTIHIQRISLRYIMLPSQAILFPPAQRDDIKLQQSQSRLSRLIKWHGGIIYPARSVVCLLSLSRPCALLMCPRKTHKKESRPQVKRHARAGLQPLVNRLVVVAAMLFGREREIRSHAEV